MDAFDELRRKGFAAAVGFGRRPAIVVVDMMRAFTDPASALGADLEAEVAATRGLLDAARAVGVPIVFTTTEYGSDLSDAGLFVRKVPSLRHLVEGSAAVELDPRLGRRDGEAVVIKKFASAFFATDLASRLRRLGIDTVLIAGCTTSGCIRATAVDALQNGFHAIVPRQCVGDRSTAAHAANLFDIHAKYGDVVELDDALGWLDGLREAAP
jgi:nicotinamidase-related amidase